MSLSPTTVMVQAPWKAYYALTFSALPPPMPLRVTPELLLKLPLPVDDTPVQRTLYAGRARAEVYRTRMRVTCPETTYILDCT